MQRPKRNEHQHVSYMFEMFVLKNTLTALKFIRFTISKIQFII